MDVLKIGGKEYEISMSYGTYEKIIKSQAVEGDTPADSGRRLINNLWVCLKRRWGFKPFLFKWRLKNKITIKELLQSDELLADMMAIEDRQGGN